MNEEEISKLSHGPYVWSIIQDGPQQKDWVLKNLEFGSGDIHAIALPSHPASVIGSDPERPEHVALLCMTGNGPNSKNNARALVCLLSQRDYAIKAKARPLPIPTTPEAVAWSEYAIELEHALGIATPIPQRLKDWKIP